MALINMKDLNVPNSEGLDFLDLHVLNTIFNKLNYESSSFSPINNKDEARQLVDMIEERYLGEGGFKALHTKKYKQYIKVHGENMKGRSIVIEGQF